MQDWSFKIRTQYGSNFQKQVWHEAIHACLMAVKIEMESKHKNNKMEIDWVEK